MLPVVLAVLAGVFAYQALQARSAMTEVVVAKTDIAAGQPVSVSDTKMIAVHASDEELTQGLLAPAQLGGPWAAAVDLVAGEALTRAELVPAGQSAGLGAMSVAVPEDQAVGGALSAGDLVDIVEAGGPGGSHYVAQDLRVLDVASSAGGGVAALGGASGQYYVVVAVTKQTALAISAALVGGGNATGNSGLEIVRLPSSAVRS